MLVDLAVGGVDALHGVGDADDEHRLAVDPREERRRVGEGGVGPVVGFDLVELPPDYDPTQISSITASVILREMILTFCFKKEGKGIKKGQKDG